MMRPCVFVLAAAALAPLPVSGQQTAVKYPERAIRFVIPYAPGGGTDIVGRAVAQQLSLALGQQVVPDNRAGGAGMIGCDIVAKSAPDGYTLLATSGGPFAVNPSLFAKMPFDPVRDFAPITLVATYSSVLVTHPSLPVRSVKELIAFAKAHAGQISYASGGIGTTQHLSGEMLKAMTGIDIMHVPYKGTGPAFIDLMGGHVSIFFSSPGTVAPHRKSGKVTLLAVTGAKRSAAFPELPTVAETLPGFEAEAWIGLFAPRATPSDIVARLNREVVKVLQSPNVRTALSSENYEVIANSPAEFSAYIRQDLERWSNVIKKAGIRIDQ